jgi:hypothetical protein
LRRKHQYKPLYLQAHCQSRTSQRYSRSLVKELAKPTQGEFQNIFSSPSKKIKTPDTQADTTKTLKRSVENGLQGRPRRTPAGNTGLAKVAVQCSADTFVVNLNLVLRINICGENRHLRQARKRYASCCLRVKKNKNSPNEI